MPQAFGSSGGQEGIGSMLTRATSTLFWAEAEEVCVVATASKDEDEDEGANDVFHNGIPLKLYVQKKISLDKQDEVTIGYRME